MAGSVIVDYDVDLLTYILQSFFLSRFYTFFAIQNIKISKLSISQVYISNNL